METDPDIYLPNLSEYIVFEKMQKKNVIRIECSDFLKEFGESIRKIDVYYNPYTTELEGVSEQMAVYDIRTQKEVG